MANRTDRSLVLIGSGPGIGRHVAIEYARKRFNKIALVARNPTQLAEDKAAVEAAVVDGKVDVQTFAVDITDTAKFRAELENIGRVVGTPECVYFNAARIIPTPFFQATEEDILYDFKVGVQSPAYPQALQMVWYPNAFARLTVRLYMPPPSGRSPSSSTLSAPTPKHGLPSSSRAPCSPSIRSRIYSSSPWSRPRSETWCSPCRTYTSLKVYTSV